MYISWTHVLPGSVTPREGDQDNKSGSGNTSEYSWEPLPVSDKPSPLCTMEHSGESLFGILSPMFLQAIKKSKPYNVHTPGTKTKPHLSP